MIIDTHVHVYDPTRPQGVPWPPSSAKEIYRPVLPRHCREVAQPHGVTGVIVVEASEWVEDNAWVLNQIADDPFVLGFVGNLRPGAADFAYQLERFTQNLLFRGLRLRGPALEELDQRETLADLESAAARGLEIDLLVRGKHLATVPQLAAQVPGTPLVINHVGGATLDGQGPAAEWLEGMTAAARCDQVYCKLSGLVAGVRQKPIPVDIDFYRPVLDALWRLFGADRLLYASDWPNCCRWADYATVFRLVQSYLKEKGAGAEEKCFHRNAQAVYRWPAR